MSATVHAYIGRATGCGCIRSAVVDKPSDPAWTAGHVADMVRDGLAVERVPVEAVRSTPWRNSDCAAHAPKPKQEALL